MEKGEGGRKMEAGVEARAMRKKGNDSE